MSSAHHDEFLAELMAAFSTESAEQLQALNRNLLALEHQDFPDDGAKAALLRETFRQAHTLKGGAAAVDLPEVRDLAHHLESFFSAVQSGAIKPDEEEFDLLYRAVDALGVLIRSALEGGGVTGFDTKALCDQLDAAAMPDRAARAVDGGGTAEIPMTYAAHGLTTPIETTSRDEEANQAPRRSAEAGRSSEELVRIPVAKLDALMSDAGELLVARNAIGRDLSDLRDITRMLVALPQTWEAVARSRRTKDDSRTDRGALETIIQTISDELRQELGRLETTVASLRTVTRRSDHVASQLHDDVRDSRMLPLERIVESFPRMVRDLAREQGKEVKLQMEGSETELDRSVLEQIKAPLIHLVRNALDHGLEEPDVRRAHGKAEQGTIHLSAGQRGDTVVIEVSDDGRGVDAAAVRAAAVSKGLVPREDEDPAGETDGVRFVFHPGLSTSTIVTEVSGRGVGLDVVRANVEGLGGSVDVASRQGQGTTFSLVLPLTVAITRCLLVDIGSGRLAVPVMNVVKVLSVEEDDIRDIEGARTIESDGQVVPLLDLSHQLGMTRTHESASAGGPVVVVRSRRGVLALSVDAVLDVQDLVVKPLPGRVAGARGATGAAILDTGEVALVLNVADLGSSTGRVAPRAAEAAASPDEKHRTEPGKTILLADDSLTTRTLEKNILQAAGYTVRAVADGVQAWDLLQTEGIDLVVSDVQMPGLDGFELTEKIRGDRRFQNLPIVLVTSLDTPEDRRRGMQAGADAYIVKSGFDQEHLVDVIRRLI